MTTAIVCTALLGLLLFGLGFAISVTRGRTGINYGAPDDPAHPLHKLCRAHGNAAEYGAMIAVLILLIGLRDPEPWMLWAMGITTAARYSHAAGMIACKTLDGVHPLRFIGALGTYLGGLALCVAAAMTL